MHPSLRETAHRPWPLPSRPWSWRQSWVDLAFIHYRVAADQIQRVLPAGVRVQTFNGSAWVGVVPFRMSGVMRRPFPDLPGFSSFPELNLRTYVETGGKPGVWFFSLDAASWPVVKGGRYVYGLPYHHATMRHQPGPRGIDFASERRGGAPRFRARYRPLHTPFYAEPGTFEHWATERYCLYARSQRGALNRVEVHHAPWPLQHAEVELEENGLLEAAGIAVMPEAPLCHYSLGVHVVSYGPEMVTIG